MSTTPALEQQETASTADDFAALEQRVVRTVELLRQEREARAAAESNAHTLQQLLDEQGTQLAETENRLRALESERTDVRGRVERMLKQLDEIAG